MMRLWTSTSWYGFDITSTSSPFQFYANGTWQTFMHYSYEARWVGQAKHGNPPWPTGTRGEPSRGNRALRHQWQRQRGGDWWFLLSVGSCPLDPRGQRRIVTAAVNHNWRLSRRDVALKLVLEQGEPHCLWVPPYYAILLDTFESGNPASVDTLELLVDKLGNGNSQKQQFPTIDSIELEQMSHCQCDMVRQWGLELRYGWKHRF